MSIRQFVACLVVFTLLSVCTPAQAWWAPGHELATRQAVRWLDGTVPRFMVEGEATLVHLSIDPDMMRSKAMPALRDVEAPDHYFDAELMPGFTEDLAALPPTRNEYLKSLAKHDVAARDAGTLPYALLEWTERLTYAFAEHRRFPDDPIVKQKCLLYAGLLAHYAQDACQPLHLTIEFDGRLNDKGKTGETGIHEKIDSLPNRLTLSDLVRPVHFKDKNGNAIKGKEGNLLAPDLAFESLFDGVREQMIATRKLLDKAYELEAALPPAMDMEPLEGKVREFAVDRVETGGRFTARLIITAWVNSEKVELPDWHRKPLPELKASHSE